MSVHPRVRQTARGMSCVRCWLAFFIAALSLVACASERALDFCTRALVKLALAVGVGSRGAVHAHVRKSLELDISQDEIRHVVALALPAIGFARMMAALSWVDDILVKTK